MLLSDGLDDWLGKTNWKDQVKSALSALHLKLVGHAREGEEESWLSTGTRVDSL